MMLRDSWSVSGSAVSVVLAFKLSSVISVSIKMVDDLLSIDWYFG